MVDTFQWINQGIVAPIIVIVVSALLINVIGAYALIGIGIMIVLFPLVCFRFLFRFFVCSLVQFVKL